MSGFSSPHPPPPKNIPNGVEIIQCDIQPTTITQPTSMRPHPSIAAVATAGLGNTQVTYLLRSNPLHYLNVDPSCEVRFTSGKWYFLHDKEQLLGLFFCVGVDNFISPVMLKMTGWLASTYDVYNTELRVEANFEAKDFILQVRHSRDGIMPKVSFCGLKVTIPEKIRMRIIANRYT